MHTTRNGIILRYIHDPISRTECSRLVDVNYTTLEIRCIEAVYIPRVVVQTHLHTTHALPATQKRAIRLSSLIARRRKRYYFDFDRTLWKSYACTAAQEENIIGSRYHFRRRRPINQSTCRQLCRCLGHYYGKRPPAKSPGRLKRVTYFSLNLSPEPL